MAFSARHFYRNLMRRDTPPSRIFMAIVTAKRPGMAILFIARWFTRRSIASAITNLRSRTWGSSMMDFVMLGIGLALFIVSVGYVYACDQL
jgi:hypothetical protein